MQNNNYNNQNNQNSQNNRQNYKNRSSKNQTSRTTNTSNKNIFPKKSPSGALFCLKKTNKWCIMMVIDLLPSKGRNGECI